MCEPSFWDHFKEKISKINRGIKILKKTEQILTRHSLIILCESLIRPHLENADMIYDQLNHLNLCNEIETFSTTQV